MADMLRALHGFALFIEGTAEISIRQQIPLSSLTRIVIARIHLADLNTFFTVSWQKNTENGLVVRRSPPSRCIREDHKLF